MTIYQELQSEFLKWDQAVDEQGEQLVMAATQLVIHLPKYLGTGDASVVRLGVGAGDEFTPRELEANDCEPDGSGELKFTIRLTVLPTGNPDYKWVYDVEVRLSISGEKYSFSTLSVSGDTRHSASILPIDVQAGAFAPVYEAIVRTVKDDFDSTKVKRLG